MNDCASQLTARTPAAHGRGSRGQANLRERWYRGGYFLPSSPGKTVSHFLFPRGRRVGPSFQHPVRPGSDSGAHRRTESHGLEATAHAEQRRGEAGGHCRGDPWQRDEWRASGQALHEDCHGRMRMTLFFGKRASQGFLWKRASRNDVLFWEATEHVFFWEEGGGLGFFSMQLDRLIWRRFCSCRPRCMPCDVHRHWAFGCCALSSMQT